MQTSLSSIWTSVVLSIFCDINRYSVITFDVCRHFSVFLTHEMKKWAGHLVVLLFESSSHEITSPLDNGPAHDI